MDVQQTTDDAIRYNFSEILRMLRNDQKTAGQSEKGRALSIAITQTEIASMCAIRSFFADQPYSPLNKLKPANT